MVGLLKTDYNADDLSYEKAAPTVGVGDRARTSVFSSTVTAGTTF